MRVLSVSEFKQWLCINPIKVLIFSAEDNDTSITSCITSTLRFSKLIVGADYERIALLDGRDSLCFNRVREVHLYDNGVGTVFEFLCEDGSTNHVFRVLAF